MYNFKFLLHQFTGDSKFLTESEKFLSYVELFIMKNMYNDEIFSSLIEYNLKDKAITTEERNNSFPTN